MNESFKISLEKYKRSEYDISSDSFFQNILNNGRYEKSGFIENRKNGLKTSSFILTNKYEPKINQRSKLWKGWSSNFNGWSGDAGWG